MNKLYKIFSILLLMLIIINPVMAQDTPCFTIQSLHVRNTRISNNNQPIILIMGNNDMETVIEIHTGGYFGTNRKMCFNVLGRQNFEIILDPAMYSLPIYITCHKALTEKFDASGCWSKLELLDAISFLANENLTADKPIESIINYQSMAIDQLTGIINNLPLVNSTIPTTITLKANITQQFENTTTSNIWVNLLGWFYFVFGLFLTIRFAFKIGDR